MRGGSHFLTPNLEKSLARVPEEHRPGGRLAIVAADLFSYEPKLRFHAIVSRRAYQGFPLDRREELARRFFRWLRPGGFAFVEMSNIHERKGFEGPFRAAGFREVTEPSKIPAGQRGVRFYHASG
jgi:hypothetical protein